MIVEGLLSVVITVLSTLFNLLPSLPAMPEIINYYWAEFITILGNGLSFLMVFCVPEVVMACLGIVIAIFLFDEMYDVILWFIRKIPFLGIK